LKPALSEYEAGVTTTSCSIRCKHLNHKPQHSAMLSVWIFPRNLQLARRIGRLQARDPVNQPTAEQSAFVRLHKCSLLLEPCVCPSSELTACHGSFQTLDRHPERGGRPGGQTPTGIHTSCGIRTHDSSVRPQCAQHYSAFIGSREKADGA
jgi:hypothetical protein